MKIPQIPSSEITPEHVYRSRRAFMRNIGALAAGSLVLAACGTEADTETSEATENRGISNTGNATTTTGATSAAGTSATAQAAATTDELGDSLTAYEAVTSYNNYYEFTTDKEGVAEMSKNFTVSPWTVAVGGLVNKPQTFAMEDLLKQFPPEERVYRLRCVEGWSMVIPWLGFPLNKLLAAVEPTSKAKYVRFETVMRPEEMPGQQRGPYNWPYVEGLRLDEAMNDLTLMATGLYGKQLLPQNGAPLRLAVPWKYGFKSIKSIVKIDLVEEQPTSLWMAAASHEYGFYANVNPDVPHPRWSQSSERRIGELGRRKTLPFNGYAEQVADLYAGMDLKANY